MLAAAISNEMKWSALVLGFVATIGHAQTCVLEPAAGMLVGSRGTEPQIVAGEGEILVAHEPLPSGPRLAEFDTRPFVARIVLPIGSTPATTLVAGADGIGSGVFDDVVLRRLGTHAAALLTHHDTIDGDSCPCWSGELRVPSAPGLEGTSRFTFGMWITDSLFTSTGDSILAVLLFGDGAIDTLAFGAANVPHQRVLAPRSPDAASAPVSLRLRAQRQEGIDFALMRESGPMTALSIDARGNRIGAPGRVARDTTWPIEVHEGAEHRLVVRGPSEGERPIEGLSQAPRFSPSLIELEGRTWLVYAEGLRSRTRLFAVPFDGTRITGTPVRIGPDRETGRVATDVYGGNAFVAWVEHARTGWETRVAQLHCNAH
jgi:hypothetical protein